MIDKRVLELIRLPLKHEKHAAEEVGQWQEKTPVEVEHAESSRRDYSKLTLEELYTMIRILKKTEASQSDAVAEAKHVNVDQLAGVKQVNELDQIIERAVHR